MVVPLAGFLGGIGMGYFEKLYLNRRFERMSFAKMFICKTLIYLVIVFGFIIVTSILGQMVRDGDSTSNLEKWGDLYAFLSSFAFYSAMIFVGMIISVSLFFAEVGNYLGASKLNNFLFGKYHRPIIEDRIFMFLDMKSSTTIAEELGHVSYFNMLKDYFSTISPETEDYFAEIYQYVGDEIVLSWSQEDGLENDNCLRCFFAMKDALEGRAAYFSNTYGTAPVFKAGVHIGEVTSGEIGEQKKEIVYTGDPLNTTARIQSLCNEFEVDLLISSQLVEALDLKGRADLRNLGSAKLRGRLENVELFTLSDFPIH